MDNTARIIIVGTTRFRGLGSKFPIPQRSLIYHEDSIAPTITATTYKEPTKIMTMKEPASHITDGADRRGEVAQPAGAKFSAGKVFRPRPDDISNTLTSNTKDNMLIEHTPILIRQANEQGYIECPPGGVFDASYPNSPTRRGRVQDGGEVTPTICSAQQGLCLYEGVEPKIIGYSRDNKGNIVSRHFKDTANTLTATTADAHRDTTAQYIYQPSSTMQYRIRKLTPRECFRLMDVDDESIDLIQSAGISKSQQYKLAGNSIVVSCLYHIFHKMFIDTSVEEPLQLSLFDF